MSLQNQDIYWNPILETLPQEKLQALQLKKFKRTVVWAYDHSPFYKKLYKNAGVEAGDIKTFDDIRKLHPFGSLPRYEVKAKCFKDQRKKGG